MKATLEDSYESLTRQELKNDKIYKVISCPHPENIGTIVKGCQWGEYNAIVLYCPKGPKWSFVGKLADGYRFVEITHGKLTLEW